MYLSVGCTCGTSSRESDIHTFAYTIYVQYFSRDSKIHTVVHDVNVRFWPALAM
jgi:hypothetical protein